MLRGPEDPKHSKGQELGVYSWREAQAAARGVVMSIVSSPVHLFLALAATMLAIALPTSAQEAPNRGCPIGGYAIIACPIVNDQVIREAVKQRLAGSVISPWTSVTVRAKDGVVTLTGTVDTEARRDLATIFSRGLRGVVCVDNQLVVNPGEKSREDLVGAVRRALGTGLFGVKGIFVDVSGDIVRLSGMVQTDFDREQAGMIAYGVPGVSAVQNNLIVRDPYNNEL